MITPKILLIDNDPHFRESLAKDVLETEGYHVLQAHSAQRAGEILQEELIHLAIVDIRLTNDDNPRDRSGLDLCATLPPTVPRLILTGYPEWDVVRGALQLDAAGQRLADGFLFKGEGPEGVLNEVQRVVKAEYEIIPQRRIAILTGGADSPGMNAAIRTVVRSALDQEMEVLGIQGGFQGLVDNQMRKLSWLDVHDIMVQNGSLLGANRFPEFQNPLVRRPAVQHLLDKHISGLVVLGGEGSIKGALALANDMAAHQPNFQVVAIPATIDNDVWGTDLSLGAASVANAMIEDLRPLLSPAQTRRRIYVIEAPGRFCGYLTLQTALGISADAAIIPEDVVTVYPSLNAEETTPWPDQVNIDQTMVNFRLKLAEVAQQLESNFAQGKRYGFVVLSEGIGQLTGGLLDGDYVCRYLEDRIKQWATLHRPEVRAHVLGFPVRGVPPDRFDIWLGARLGAAAVAALAAGRSQVMVGRGEDQQIGEIPLAEVVEKSSRPPKELWRTRPHWLRQLPELQDLLARPPKLQNPTLAPRSSFEQREHLHSRVNGKAGKAGQPPTNGVLSKINTDEVYATIHKNSINSYGLTLVAGMPFALAINAQVKAIQEELDHLAPDRFIWYGTDHLHVTLVALLRGRYREGVWVRRAELAPDLASFVQRINHTLDPLRPFTLELGSVSLTTSGSVIVKVSESGDQVVPALRQALALDQPTATNHLHVSIGYLSTPRPLVRPDEIERFEQAYQQLASCPIGRIEVEQLWLVHYANRQLNRVVGKLLFPLGAPSQLTVEQFVEQIRVA